MKDKRKKVFVVVLNQGTNSAGLESKLIEWMSDLREDYDFLFHPSKYAYRPISANRNKIVSDFLKTDSKFLVMIDDDNPPLQNFFKLLDLNKDVIAVPVPGRGKDIVKWLVFSFGKEYPEKIVFEPFPLNKREGLQKVDAVSSGCMIVSRRVLKKIKRPFDDIFDEEGMIINSDDMAFAHRVKQNGFQEWTHFDYQCSHYKTMDLLEVISLGNKMYDLGFKHGQTVDKLKIKPMKLSEFLNKQDGDNRGKIGEVKKDGKN